MTKNSPDLDWDAIYDEQLPRLYNFFHYRTGNADLSKDLTAQTMMRAWRFRHKYNQDIGAFEAWLFQIARSIAADDWRKNQQTVVWLDDAEAIPSDINVEAEIQKRDMAACLYHLLLELSTQEQDIIALKFGADLTNRAIAEVLSITESNVGTILHRTIKKLKLQWELTYA